MNNKKRETMKKNSESRKFLPKLRFPEFRDAAAWSDKALIDVADKSVRWSFVGGPFGSSLKSSDYTTTGVRIIQLQNIGDGEFLDQYKIYTSEGKAEELLSNNIYPGDILISKMGDPVGRACLVPQTERKYVMCSDGIRLNVDEGENVKYFVYSLINSPPIRSSIERASTGSTRKRIGMDELRNLSIPIPEKDEQQKVADCLASLDALIAAEAEKLAALKAYKTALMQQLFPSPLETV
jgi:type I restriction enzyme, S subunit